MAKHLTEVFKLNFNRVPNSGAFTGGKNIEREKLLTTEQKLLVSADIIVPIELSHVSFECKHYADFHWNVLFSGKGESKLNSWIKQMEDIKKKVWFICFKIDYKGQFVCYPKHLQNRYSIRPCGTFLDCNINEKRYLITKLDGFFEYNRGSILNAR